MLTSEKLLFVTQQLFQLNCGELYRKNKLDEMFHNKRDQKLNRLKDPFDRMERVFVAFEVLFTSSVNRIMH